MPSQVEANHALLVENEDEWEFEYSATEKETYYITLDLSVRDFLERRTDDIIHNTRGGYRVWYNPLFNAAEPQASNAAFIDDKDVDDNEPPEREEADKRDNSGLQPPRAPTEPPVDPRLQLDNGQDRDYIELPTNTNVPAEEIQILNLHSERPLVSYRNHVFRGSWCANIGTEMIFTPHDEQVPLPALRNLNQNIDLIAASACRINFTETTLRNKNPANGHGEQDDAMGVDSQEEDLPARYKRNGGIYVHVGGDKSGQRQPQRTFSRISSPSSANEMRRRKLHRDQQRNMSLREKRRDNIQAGLGVEQRPYGPVRGSGGRRRPRTRARRTTLVRRDTSALSRVGTQHRIESGSVLQNQPTPRRWDELE
ncbi:uncharacterized protein PODANS_2_13650 [Podospora anserina S mat+]|uniref:Podospora anserina S mat+ genomic DNA chromosome 2, supercontig 3 n=1 Tax=Podospora anserina (strain S / ATCC MYA-4624 / DSM 980 / FGSC 10383) TaxID=515849 RepID=B2ABY6_PODAN|nr:uncharacterized protein PODANS_2_13650 [Podospora anserina S mat+]CAP60965.1 unnamed protein product [Podospora anserina S mat+]